jgi:hypothetical protein
VGRTILTLKERETIQATAVECRTRAALTRNESARLVACSRRLVASAWMLRYQLPRPILGGALDLNGELRERVRRGLSTGALFPVAKKTWAGQGTGQMCRVCSNKIGPEYIEYEVEGPDGTRAYAHLPCYFIWEQESRTARS